MAWTSSNASSSATGSSPRPAPWLSRTGAEVHPQELAQSLREACPLEIQIVDTPKALETTVSASFAASHHQINRTLVLATEEPLVPSSGFATAVMEQVREAASAPPPLPFPWRRFVVGALVVAVMSGLSGWLLATLPVAASLPAALDRLLAAVADRQVALALASTLGSLLGTLLLVRLSLSLAGGRG